MSQKTNNSVISRVKTSKKGTLLVSGKGRGHFNAKHSRSKKLKQKKEVSIKMSSKLHARYFNN